MPEHYITAGGKRLRCGRTTGTCAAMAAAGAVRLLLTGRAPDLISLNTPRDWMVEAPLLDCVADGEGLRPGPPPRGCPPGPRAAAGGWGGRPSWGGPGWAGSPGRGWTSRWGRRPSTRCPGG